MSDRFPSLPNIEFLIDGNGEITIGEVGPVACAATACTENQALAILVRRDVETVVNAPGDCIRQGLRRRNLHRRN